MDTLSATTTAGLFKLPASTSRELHNVTTAAAASLLPPPHQHYHLSSAPKPAGSRRRSLTSSASTPAVVLSSKSHLKPAPAVAFHRRAASGYAAALLDSAQLGGSAALSGVARDVRRFSKLLRREEIRDIIGDASREEIETAGIMKSIAEKGRFHAQLKLLLNLLIEKGKLGIFGEVLDEFERIYQLLGLGIPVAS